MKDSFKKELNLKYTITETRNITWKCYAPKSKYILIKNIISGLILVGLLTLMFWCLASVGAFERKDIRILIYFMDLCAVLMLGAIIYTIRDEWVNGRDYKTIIKYAQENPANEESTTILQQIEEYEKKQITES